MKKRWICLYVENEIGVLARIAGLFSSKSYNMDSLTAGVTEDETISRMTIGLTSDDQTFEQIKKQLNRSIEVIKVIDYTHIPIHIKELLYVKLCNCSEEDQLELGRTAMVFGISMTNYSQGEFLLECVQSEDKNNELIDLLKKSFSNRLEVVRGGSVAIEAGILNKEVKLALDSGC